MVNARASWCNSTGSKSKQHDNVLMQNWNVILLNLISFLHLVAPAERFLYGCYWDPTPERRVPWGYVVPSLYMPGYQAHCCAARGEDCHTGYCLWDIITLVRHNKPGSTAKCMVQHKKARFDTKMPGSTQKCPTQHASVNIAIIKHPPPPYWNCILTLFKLVF